MAAEIDDATKDYRLIKTERRGPVFIARFYNPPRNLMTAPMVAELSDLLAKVDKADEVRVLILTGGVDGYFIQHYDVAELVTTAEAAVQNPAIGAGPDLHGTHQTYLRIEALSKPVIAAINGMAHGGGFELALACDFRYLAKGYTVGLPEVNVGILPGAGGTQRLPRLIGLGRALDLILRGQVVDAETAERYGMVHRALEPEKLLDEAMALANQLAALPPLAVSLAKQSMRRGIDMPLQDALRLEEDNFWKLMRSEDAIRLMKQYAESGQGGL